MNTFFMAIGVFAALSFVSRHHALIASDGWVLLALYFIVLEFVIITALALFFSSFSSPLLSAVFTFSLFVIGTFSEDLRGFAKMAHGIVGLLVTGVSYIVPNFSALNIIDQVAHGHGVASELIAYNSAYALIYTLAVLAGATLIFERRSLK